MATTYHISISNSFHFVHVEFLYNLIEKCVQIVQQINNVHWGCGRRDGRKTDNVAKVDGDTFKRLGSDMLPTCKRSGNRSVKTSEALFCNDRKVIRTSAEAVPVIVPIGLFLP